ncbi:MAG: MFS transporter [Liquorilactobacillus nagelii]|jgi:sugar phosphate permease|uniref:MFS transporter n=1 Tax=Liquorilactobacillus nagelii TaxID=82688 RepID=UPI00242CA5D1|nr:MFS transporter [Liquorilactobacillus nagelii]MCI1632721.1 MFS transporter [Liquorilactobacillus nagelii]
MEKSYQKKPKLVFGLLYFAFIICFIDRSAINIALSYIGNDFHLDATQLGVVSSAFFFSYALMQIPGGWLADKFGSKLTVLVAILMWSIFTVLTGFAWSLASLLVIRILFGIGEGAFPSASLKEIAEEFSFTQRSEATSAIISSNYAGSAIAPLIIAPVIAALGWRVAFHLMGIIGLIFVLIYYFTLRPIKQRQSNANEPKKKINWKRSLTNPVVWQFFLVVLGLSVITKGLDSWMPTYLLRVRQINLAGIAWLVPLPSISAGVAAILSGYLMVHFFKNREKWLIAVSCLLATIFMFGMYKSTSLSYVIVFEILTYFFKGLAFSGCFAFFAQLVTGEAYGSAVGIVNFGGQLAGFVAPIIIGVLIEHFNNSYSAAFLFLVVCAAFSFIVSLTFNAKELRDNQQRVIDENN